MNTEYVLTLLKFGGGMLGIMAILGAILFFTPRIAKLIDKHRKPAEDEPDDGLQDPYGAQRDEDFDPNYKIYHEDIYALNFKKKKNTKNTKEK